MATGWSLCLLIILGTTPSWQKASNISLSSTSASASDAPTTLSPPNVTSTTKTAPTKATPTTAFSTVATTLSPETNAFIQEVSKIVECGNTRCSSGNSKIPTSPMEHRCQCDAQCHLLGECCPEAAPSRPLWRQPTAPLLGVRRDYWGCSALPLRSNATYKTSVYMVTSCPHGHVLEKMCAREVPAELYDYKLDLPVVSGESGAWFQNVYCAVCHGYGGKLHKQYLSFRCSAPNGTELDSAAQNIGSSPRGAAGVGHRGSGGGGAPADHGSARGSERAAESAFDNSVDTDGSYESENAMGRRTTDSSAPTRATKHDQDNYLYVFKILQNGEYQAGKLEWVAASGVSCVLAPEPMPFGEDEGAGEVPWERPCMQLVDRCPAHWARDDRVAVLCASYAYHVVASSKGYKNPHCAQCNNETQALKCRRTLQSRIKKPRRPPSLRLVMDYEWDTAAEGCASRGGVWDALHARCQSLDEVCPDRSRYKNGRCVSDLASSGGGGSSHLESSREANEGGNCSRPDDGGGCRDEEDDGDDDGDGDGDEDSNQKDSCLRITLQPGEFELSNGSLRLTLAGSPFYGLVLPPSDYSVLSDGRALVCNDYQHVLLPTDTVQGYMTVVCLSVSAVCLTLHLIIHALLPKLHNLPGKNLQALSVALLLAQLGFLVGVSPPVAVPEPLCEAIAALVHLFYLAAFCWMNVMSVDIWRTFSTAFVGRMAANPGVAHRRYAAYAWGLPAAVVALSLLADHVPGLADALRPGYAEAGICWFGSGLGLGIYLVAPVTFILLVNIALFGVTVFHLHQGQEGSRYLRKRRIDERNERSDSAAATATTAATATPRAATPHAATPRSPTTHNANGPRDHVRFFLYVKLFVIMGATWLMGSLASLARVPALWYPFVALNGLQGAFIFVMFDLKRNVLGALWERVGGARPPRAARGTSHTATAAFSRGLTLTTATASTTTAPAPTPAAEESHQNPVKNGSVKGAVKSRGQDGADMSNGHQKIDANDSINGSACKNTNKG